MIWLSDLAQGVVLADVDLGRPASQTVTFEEAGLRRRRRGLRLRRYFGRSARPGRWRRISIFTWASTDREVAAANNALWQTLSGVRAGNVHIVGPHWFRAQTYLAANLMLDDLFATLTDVKPTIPSPAAEYVTADKAAE